MNVVMPKVPEYRAGQLCLLRPESGGEWTALCEVHGWDGKILTVGPLTGRNARVYPQQSTGFPNVVHENISPPFSQLAEPFEIDISAQDYIVENFNDLYL